MSSSPESRSRGELIVVSAPSGAGKTTLVRNLLSAPEIEPESLAFAVSHTTRARRGAEKEGQAYYFVDDETFDGLVKSGAFLEWAHVHGRKYGTSKQEVEARLAAGTDVQLEIDVQGAEQVRGTHPEAFMVFILPPSYSELERRLLARGEDGLDTIRQRLAVSLWEIERYDLYDCVIINDDLERASAQLVAAIQARRLMKQRAEKKVRQVIEDFRQALSD